MNTRHSVWTVMIPAEIGLAGMDHIFKARSSIIANWKMS